MLTRLANVLWWLSLAIGGLLAALGVILLFSTESDAKVGLVSIVCGLLVAGFGRATLYVLAAK